MNQPTKQRPPVQKLAYTVTEAAEAMSVSKDKIYDLVGAGQIGYYRMGRDILIPHDSVLAYQARRVEETMLEEHNLREFPRLTPRS